MKTISLVPGSAEWLKSRSASKAPAMMGDSPYQTRSQLLHQMATGITKDVDAATQARFDNGHRTEALSRKLAEEIIGEELAPTSAASDDDYLTANFDGITFADNIGYEHKDWNEKLATSVRSGVIPNSHAWQLDQQIYVGNLEYVLFVVSDGTKERFVSHKYYANQTRIDMLLAGWKVFDADLAAYVPPEVAEKPIPTAVMALPALQVQIRGEVTASNMPAFIAVADAFLGRIKTELTDDQDFADADANIKACDTAEKGIEQAKAAITAQAADIDTIMRTMDLYKTKLRDVRLKLTKLVDSERMARKLDIVSAAGIAFSAHVQGLETETRPIQLNITSPDFAGATKNKRTITSIKEAVNQALVNGKIEADAVAKDLRGKLMWYWNQVNQTGFGFLFHDLQQIITKPADDFKLLVITRIDNHKKSETEKIERIRADEEAKARAKVEAEAAALFEQARKEEAAKHVTQYEQPKPNVHLNVHLIDSEPIDRITVSEIKATQDVGVKRQRPTDAEIIRCVIKEFHCSSVDACNWIMDVAENMVVSR